MLQNIKIVSKKLTIDEHERHEAYKENSQRNHLGCKMGLGRVQTHTSTVGGTDRWFSQLPFSSLPPLHTLIKSLEGF